MYGGVIFFTRRCGLLKWEVASIYPDNVARTEAGPFWSWVTAEKVRAALVMHFRNGWDMAK